jgi:predicted MFS family arabinose efflux permease
MLVPLASGSHTTVLVMVFAAEFLSGMGVMILDIVGGSLQTAVVPDDLRARVSGAHRMVNYGIRPIGALVGGALGVALGVRPTLWIATAGAVAGVLWLLASPIPRVRRL